MRVRIDNSSILVHCVLRNQVGVSDKTLDTRSFYLAHLAQLVWEVLDWLSEEEVGGAHLDGGQGFA